LLILIKHFCKTARGIIHIEHIMLNGRKEKVNLLNGIKGFDIYLHIGSDFIIMDNFFSQKEEMKCMA
jgi:hypothetical protein